jgi:thiamine biosynthesis lipoprotein
VPLPIALEHPDDPAMAIGIARISNQSICGSSGNRRAWGVYHHIINPHSLTSPQHTRALWVIARNGLTADGLATALFFVPAEVLATNFDFEYAIINEDYSLHHSMNFPAEFYTNIDRVA